MANKETVLLEIKGDSRSGQKALTGLSKKLDAFGKKWQQVAQNLRRVGAGMSAAGAATLGVFAKLGEAGAGLEGVEKKFDRLMRGLGKNADEMLDAWTRASRGAVDEANLMAKSNYLALTGVPVGEMEWMLQAVQNSVDATGGSFAVLFDKLSAGLARGSKQMLDDLGIIVSVGQANENYAKSVGKTTKQLTAQEQKLAFVAAAREAAARQEEVLGKAVESSATKIARGRASIKNFADDLRKLFVPVAVKAANVITALVAIWRKIPGPVKQAVANLLAAGAGIAAIAGPIVTLIGLLPKIKAILGAVSGGLKLLGIAGASGLGPVIAIVGGVVVAVLALVGVVKLVKKAWDENWGGIQETVQRVVDVVKPVLDGIARDIRYWIGQIRASLAGIMSSVRSLVEPALARLRELFGDGAGLKDFLVTLRDGINVALSLVAGLVESINSLLQGRADEAWKPLKDAGLNIITLIVIAWRKWISKAFSYGWNLIVEFANGIIKAARTVLVQAANFIGQMLARFLAPGSPPKEGPLSGIVKWAIGLGNTFFRSFKLADFGILRDSLAPMKQALQSAVDVGDISQGDMLSTFRDVRTMASALIADFRKTGQVNEDILSGINAKLGESGAEYTKYLRLTLEHQRALENLRRVEDEVSAAEAAGFVPADLKNRLQAAQDEADAKQEAVDWQREYLASIQDTVDIQRELLAAMQEMTETMKEGLSGKDIADAIADAQKGIDFEKPEGEVDFAGFGGFSDEFEKVRGEVENFFSTLPSKIEQWLNQAKAILLNWVLGILVRTRTTLLQIGAILLLRLLEFRQTIIDKLAEIWQEIVAWWTRLKGDVKIQFIKIKAEVGAFFHALNIKIRLKIYQIIRWLEERWTLFKTWIDERIAILKTVGENIMQGFWDGLKGRYQQLKGWFEERLDAIKNMADLVFGNRSPSKVFEKIGQNVIAGLQIGLDVGPVLDQVKAGLGGVVGAAAGAMSGGLGAAAVGGMGQRVVVIQNLNLPGVRDGRDAQGLLDRLEQIADRAGDRGVAPGGIM